MTHLSNEDKINLITEQLSSLASQTYQVQMNFQICQAANDQAGIDAANSLLAQYAISTTVYQKELDKLASA
jgi:hypothetical protein